MVFYWTGRHILPTSAWIAWDNGGVRAQIKSPLQVTRRRYLRTSGIHAGLSCGEVDNIMTFYARAIDSASLTAVLRLWDDLAGWCTVSGLLGVVYSWVAFQNPCHWSI